MSKQVQTLMVAAADGAKLADTAEVSTLTAQTLCKANGALMLRIIWTPNTGAAVTVFYNRISGAVRCGALILGTVTRGAHGGFVWARQGQLETRNGGPTVEMAVWALCAQCRKDGTV